MRKEINIEELAKLVGGKINGDKSCLVRDVATIEDAKEGEITFLAELKNIKHIKDSKASAIIVSKECEGAEELTSRNIIVVDEPRVAFAYIMDILRPEVLPEASVSAKAEIDPSAKIGSEVAIGAFAVIEAEVEISDNAVIYPGVYIARGSSIGKAAVIHSNVSIMENTWIGVAVIIHSNSVIGSDGFGYTWDKDKYKKIPQRGSVKIEEGCEIGASVTIDRGTIGKTVIEKGTKIDNLVHIAHNVVIGENSILAGQVGIAGSTKIGKRVQMGGQAGLIDHIEIGDDARIGAKAGVLGNVPEGATFSGLPAIPHRLWLRVQSLAKKLPDMKKGLKKLEERMANLEKDKDKSN